MLNFIKCEIIPNKFDKSGTGTPLIELTYNLGKKDVSWSFGVSKAIEFMKAVESNWNDYQEHKDSLWSCTVQFNNNGVITEYPITRTKIEVLNHYKNEIYEYISSNHKSSSAIAEPKIVIVEDNNTGDYIPTLYLPCYQKGQYDEGEGLLPLTLTQKECKYLFDTDSTGVTIKTLKSWNEQNPENHMYIR